MQSVVPPDDFTLSVVVPVYNEERMLATLAASVRLIGLCPNRF